MQELCADGRTVVADFVKHLQKREEDAENNILAGMALHSPVHDRSAWHDTGMHEAGKKNLHFATWKQKKCILRFEEYPREDTLCLQKC